MNEERMQLLQSYADELNGNHYGEEGNADLFRHMKADRVVAVFGYSDDLMLFRGAIDDETGYEEAFVTKAGLLENNCESDRCPHFKKLKKPATQVYGGSTDTDGGSMFHFFIRGPNRSKFERFAEFKIMDDDGIYCTGIVFSLDDC